MNNAKSRRAYLPIDSLIIHLPTRACSIIFEILKGVGGIVLQSKNKEENKVKCNLIPTIWVGLGVVSYLKIYDQHNKVRNCFKMII